MKYKIILGLQCSMNLLCDLFNNYSSYHKKMSNFRTNPRSTTPKINIVRPTIEQAIQETKLFLKTNSKTAILIAKQFFYHYESRNWKTGKEPIYNWLACLKSWLITNQIQEEKINPSNYILPSFKQSITPNQLIEIQQIKLGYSRLKTLLS